MGREKILKKKFKCSCVTVNCCDIQSGKQLAPPIIKLRQDRPLRHAHQKSLDQPSSQQEPKCPTAVCLISQSEWKVIQQ